MIICILGIAFLSVVAYGFQQYQHTNEIRQIEAQTKKENQEIIDKLKKESDKGSPLKNAVNNGQATP